MICDETAVGNNMIIMIIISGIKLYDDIHQKDGQQTILDDGSGSRHIPHRRKRDTERFIQHGGNGGSTRNTPP